MNKMLEESREKNKKLEELNTFLHVSCDLVDTEEYFKFLKEHKHEDQYFGAIGGHITYNLTATSIGLMISVTCNHCNKTQDITDMSMF